MDDRVRKQIAEKMDAARRLMVGHSYFDEDEVAAQAAVMKIAAGESIQSDDSNDEARVSGAKSLIEDCRRIAAAAGITLDQAFGDQRRAMKEIEEKVSQAQALIRDCMNLSSAHGIPFDFSIPSGISDTHNPRGGWDHSAIC